MSVKISDLETLLIHELQDLHSAEKQLIEALPKMAEAASSAELRQAIEEHLEQTRGQVDRLEQIASAIGFTASGHKCKAMEGLIKEGKEMIAEDAPAEVKDAGLIAAAQRVEHYEMAGYGCARTFASMLGHSEAATLLQETLDEEADADKRLTEIAMSFVNEEAMNPADE